MDPVSIIGHSYAFEMACNDNKLHKGAARWLVLLFLKTYGLGNIYCKSVVDPKCIKETKRRKVYYTQKVRL